MARVYIINTNFNNNTICENDMISNKKCSAYCDPWKYYIDEIEPNDIVFLYKSGEGIIARGVATGIVEKADYDGVENDEHYMHLDRFQVLGKPLEPSKITELIGHKIHYRQTVISVAYRFGINVWQYITKNNI
ncbi:MAG: hypothetical protein N4A57_08080 [Anaeromicrobium sp.]|jgi:hypothetical protein|uniref:hypothetical protein n=1 Tax=Anaeromicrobium sp. TaxID=1929132 RepID=UPI0025FE86AB|nr:hypothetical protein [Anaeromicrobium sp.]MCT4594209.1 hypothetical protein [Anaeromicrobium sp.]